MVILICVPVNSPIIIGQLATLAAYAIVALLQGSEGLAVNEAITSLSLISLMITPLSYLLLAIPDMFASMGCLYRIQDFLKNQNFLGESSSPSFKLFDCILGVSDPEADSYFFTMS